MKDENEPARERRRQARRQCNCPHPHRCWKCGGTTPCDANYCSKSCYQADSKEISGR